MALLGYSVSVVLGRPIEPVFDFLSDLRHELDWNPDAKAVEKLTDGPIGLGTRFRATWARTPPTIVEIVRFERPHTWSTSSRAMGMAVTATGRLEPCAEGTRYTAAIEVRPAGFARVLAPLAVGMMRRGEARNMARIKAALEARS